MHSPAQYDKRLTLISCRKVGKELTRLWSSAREMRLKFKSVMVAMVKTSQSQCILRRKS